jgi:hypothetical protein
VGKRYTQKEGKNYFDTYSHVARLTITPVLLSLTFSHGLFVHQIDVKMVFLNEELDEKIYMKQPDVLVVESRRKRAQVVKVFVVLSKSLNSDTRSFKDLEPWPNCCK